MYRALVCSSLLLSLVVHAFAASPPAWWSNSSEYDNNPSVFVGRGCAEVSADVRKSDLEAKALTEALADAARTVYCRIMVETVSRDKETGGGKNARLDQFFESRKQVKTLLRRAPNTVLRKDIQSDHVYLLAGIPKEKLLNAYRLEYSVLVERLESSVAAAAELVKSAPLEALKGYGDALLLHDDIDECRWVVMYLDAATNAAPTVPSGRIARSTIESDMRRLSAGMTELLETQLVGGMVADVRPANTSAVVFCVYPLTYGCADIVSPFGDRLTELLAVELGRKDGWTRQTDPAKVTMWFAGRVFERGDGAQVVFQRIAADCGIEAATSRFLPRETLERLKMGQIRPENLEQMAKDALALRQGQKSNSDLKVELRIVGAPQDMPTVLREDDRPQLQIRCNRDCKTRMVHIFADGTRAVILDNFAINAEQANQWVRAPVRMRITPPFGIEQVLVQAMADGDLPPIKTRTEMVSDGTGKTIGKRVIVDGELKSELVRMRGSVNEEIFSEVVYTWTVRPKVEGTETADAGK